MILAIRKPIAFLKRDYIDDTSYQLAFVLRFTHVFFFTFVYFFLSRLIGDSAAPYLERYGGDYFSFALIGMAFTRYFSATIFRLREFIRESQVNGTLEVLLSTQTHALTIVFSNLIYPLLFTTLEVVVFFVLGVILVDINIYWSNLPVALIILFLSFISFASLGIISAGFIMVFKKGDPVARLMTLGTQLLAGEVYPISVLPVWLQFFSYLLPVTYALEGIRLALLQNYSLSQLSSTILALVIFDIILLPTGIMIFNYTVKRAKIDGSLAQF